MRILLDECLPKDLAGKLLDTDAAIFLNMAALNKTYAGPIKQFRRAIRRPIR